MTCISSVSFNRSLPGVVKDRLSTTEPPIDMIMDLLGNKKKQHAKHHSLDGELVLTNLVPCKEGLCVVQGITCLLPRPWPHAQA